MDIDNNNSNNSTESGSAGLSDSLIKADALNKVLEKIEAIFKDKEKEIKKQIKIWIWICSISLIISAILAHCLITSDLKEYDWRVIYKTVSRIAVAGSVIALLTIFFKMLFLQLNIWENNKNKLAVISSMAYFVEAAKTEEKSIEIYNKLVDIMVEFGATGLVSNNKDVKLNNIDELIASILKLVEKIKDK